MVTASEELTRALLAMRARDQRPRCGDGETSGYWTSDDATERVLAASWCAGCPIWDQCQAAADEQGAKWGVWAGIDRALVRNSGDDA